MTIAASLKKLQVYLKKNPDKKAYLAFRLGYSSTQTIDRWIERKKLPRTRIKEILNEIKEWR